MQQDLERKKARAKKMFNTGISNTELKLLARDKAAGLVSKAQVLDLVETVELESGETIKSISPEKVEQLAAITAPKFYIDDAGNLKTIESYEDGYNKGYVDGQRELLEYKADKRG